MHLNIPRIKADWEESDTRINHWLTERQALIVAFNAVCTLKPYKLAAIVNEPLATLNCLLIDYVSAGQFEILETIFEAATHSPKKVPFSNQIMVAWLTTTNQVLDFGEKYSANNYSLMALEEDMNRLGRQLADRLEIEDRLIELYAEATSILKES